MSIIKKPMLAAKVENISDVKFPVHKTPKLDGVRCLMIDGQAVSRTFKPIGNDHIRTWLEANIPDGMDGEILAGKTFNESSGNTRRKNGTPEFLFIVFDYVQPGSDLNVPYLFRVDRAEEDLGDLPRTSKNVMLLKPLRVHNEKELLAAEEKWLDEGYEGVMLRCPGGRYKCGRSSMNEQLLMKLKRFVDDEATVIGFEEEKTNLNEAAKDAFGRTKRSSHQANKVAKGTLGAIVARRESDGEVFNIGSGFDRKTCQEIWDNQSEYLGQIVKYKWFPKGSDKKPRHSVFLGFRDPSDM